MALRVAHLSTVYSDMLQTPLGRSLCGEESQVCAVNPGKSARISMYDMLCFVLQLLQTLRFLPPTRTYA